MKKVSAEEREQRRWERQKAIAFARLMDARAREARRKAQQEESK